MNETICILCVDDEPDVLDVAVRELTVLEDAFPVETAASAAEAREVLESLARRGHRVGVMFCDHVMPGEHGVDLLVALNGDPRWHPTRKVLLTGQAGLDATVQAVNHGGLAHYIAKPWGRNELVSVAQEQLAQYIAGVSIDPLPYIRHLGEHGAQLLSSIRGSDR